MQGRIPWPGPDEMDDAQAAVYDAIVGGPRAGSHRHSPLVDQAGRLHGPFNAMLASPAVGLALQGVGRALRYEGAIDDRCREIAILAVAAHHRSSYEWHVHETIARGLGLTEANLRDLRDGDTPVLLSPVEQTVARTAAILLADRDLDDATYTEAELILGTARLVELVHLIGYYETLALALRVLRTPLPEGAVDPFG